MTIKPWQERNNERTQGKSFYMTNDMQAEIDELRAENTRLSDLCDKWNSEGDELREDNKELCAMLADVDPAINEMQAVADAHAHRLAMYLELVCSDYGGKFWDMAMSVLGEYRTDMNRIHERECPTFMGEPVIPKTTGIVENKWRAT